MKDLGAFEWVALTCAAGSAVLLVWAEYGRRAALQALAMALGLVLLAVIPGCGVEKVVCAERSGLYTFTLGERIDGVTGPACIFSPPTGIVELPPSQAGSYCDTVGIVYFEPRGVPGVGWETGEALGCEWSEDGATGDCVLSAAGFDLSRAPCTSDVEVIYRRVGAR